MMTFLSVVCCAIASFQAYNAPIEPWMRDVRALSMGDCVVVTVVPNPFFSREEKSECFKEYSQRIGEESGKKTIVTQDLSAYITLCRMERRGYDEEEVDRLLARLSSIEKYCFITQ